jgi:hypothetical protein
MLREKREILSKAVVWFAKGPKLVFITLMGAAPCSLLNALGPSATHAIAIQEFA